MAKIKVQGVIDLYRLKFEELGIKREDYPHGKLLDTEEKGLEHCYGMLEEMEKFMEENRMDKVFRWLGFIQGVLWSQKIYTIADLKKHNLGTS
ncbi:MAG TPA: hypothetical protein VMR49_03025 [Candidatus Paceibacterota bacterium]|nr:hypothetical protein [Candidatus Paceibacterota bacterium]